MTKCHRNIQINRKKCVFIPELGSDPCEELGPSSAGSGSWLLIWSAHSNFSLLTASVAFSELTSPIVLNLGSKSVASVITLSDSMLEMHSVSRFLRFSASCLAAVFLTVDA